MSGSKQWVQRIVGPDRRRHELGLGSPPVVTLDDARALALANKRMVRNGQRPARTRSVRQTAPTFAQVAAITLEEYSRGKSEGYRGKFKSILNNHALPHLGKKRIDAITSQDIVAALSPVWNVKSETARKLHQAISQIMRTALGRGWIASNPTDNAIHSLPRLVIESVPRTAMPYDEVRGFISSLREAKISDMEKLAIEFTILTASRTIEPRVLEWSHISGNVWTMTLGGYKRPRNHRVSLPPRAMEILSDVKNLPGSDGSGDHIFRAARGGPIGSRDWNKILRGVFGLPYDMHGFRTSFRTWAQEKTDYPFHAAECALAHRTMNSVEKAYARSDYFELRAQMLKDWQDFICP